MLVSTSRSSLRASVSFGASRYTKGSIHNRHLSFVHNVASEALSLNPSVQRVHNENQQTVVLRTNPAMYTMRIMAAADAGRYIECMHHASQMKAAGVSPDLPTYNALILSASHRGVWLDAWAIFDDMVSFGIIPNIVTMNNLLRAQRTRSTPYVWKVLEKMNELNIKPNATTYTLIIERYVADNNLETALQYLISMKSQNLVPELSAAQNVIIMAAKHHYPRLAIDLAEWFEETSVRRLDYVTWVNCLLASANDLYRDGVLKCWKIVVQELDINPDEGLCFSVLNTAARHGLPDLAKDVLRVLEVIGVPLQECHFAAFLESLCFDGQLKQALVVLAFMRKNNIEPTDSSTRPILNIVKRDIESIDAAWTTLDELVKEGISVDISALQVIIQASNFHGDLQRAVGVYKSFPDYGIEPDVAIFNALLQGCLHARHRQLGDVLLAEMKEIKVKADQDTYEYMIRLCLTQDAYEDAFFYLEEMKAAHYRPSLQVYEALARRCILANDPRYTLVLEEMVETGYSVSREIGTLIAQHINSSSGVIEPHSQEAHAQLDTAVQAHINTGGLSFAQVRESCTAPIK